MINRFVARHPFVALMVLFAAVCLVYNPMLGIVFGLARFGLIFGGVHLVLWWLRD